MQYILSLTELELPQKVFKILFEVISLYPNSPIILDSVNNNILITVHLESFMKSECYFNNETLLIISGCKCATTDGKPIYRYANKTEFNEWYAKGKGCVYCYAKNLNFKETIISSDNLLKRVINLLDHLPKQYELKHLCNHTGLINLEVSEMFYQLLNSNGFNQCFCGIGFNKDILIKMDNTLIHSFNAIVNFIPTTATNRYDKAQKMWFFTFAILLKNGSVDVETFPNGRIPQHFQYQSGHIVDILSLKTYYNLNGTKTIFIQQNNYIAPQNKKVYDYLCTKFKKYIRSF